MVDSFLLKTSWPHEIRLEWISGVQLVTLSCLIDLPEPERTPNVLVQVYDGGWRLPSAILSQAIHRSHSFQEESNSSRTTTGNAEMAVAELILLPREEMDGGTSIREGLQEDYGQ